MSHLKVVMAALAVGRSLESASGWSLKKLVQTLRGYREMRINVGGHEAVAAVPLPPELVEIVSVFGAVPWKHSTNLSEVRWGWACRSGA